LIRLTLFFLIAILLSIIFFNGGCNALKPEPTPTVIPTPTPLSFQDYYNKALSLSKQKKYEEALNFFDKALEIEPKNKIVKNSKLEILKLLNKIKKAEVYIEKGNELYGEKNFNDSIAYYNKAIKLNPQSKDAWLYKGYSYECLEKYKIAIDCYNKVLELDPGNQDAIECSIEAKKALSNPIPSPLPKESIKEEAASAIQIDSSSNDNWKDYGIEFDSRIGTFPLRKPDTFSEYRYDDIVNWLGQPSYSLPKISSNAIIQPSRFSKLHSIEHIGELVYLNYGIGYIYDRVTKIILGIHIGKKINSTSCYFYEFTKSGSNKSFNIDCDYSVFSQLSDDLYVKKNNNFTFEIIEPNKGLIFIASGETIEESKVTDIIITYPDWLKYE